MYYNCSNKISETFVEKLFSDAQAMLSYLVNMLIILVPDDFFPLKVKGEACGACDCPPRNTEGECEAGLVCARNQLMPSLPGTCMESGNFNDHFSYFEFEKIKFIVLFHNSKP